MIPVLPETGVPAGATLALALEWPDQPPTLEQLRDIWWRDTVATMPNLPTSNAIIRVDSATTGAKVMLKAKLAGATKVFAFRFERAELPAKPAPGFDGAALVEELKHYGRGLLLPGVILKPPPEEDEKPFLQSPKKVAIALALVGGLGGLALVSIHFWRKAS